MKVHFEAYGCSLNRGECEELVEAVVGCGHSLTTKTEDADIAIIFTCGVVETTERRMLKRIGELAYFEEKLVICGCLGNISPDKIGATAPQAVIYSVSQHSQVLDLLDGRKKPDKRGYQSTKSSVGILPISSGCDGSCSYCVARLARGELKSRSPKELVNRARALIKNGTAEIQVCAQDTAAYGSDLDTTMGPLISSITSLDGEFMIRIGMMNPETASRMLPDLSDIYQNKKVFGFLHLPVQSGSDAVLGRMNRRYTIKNFLDIVGHMRGDHPDIVLSTDIIVGFPGEIETEFSETVDLVEDIQPDIVNITRFSSRPGTKAAIMKEQIPSRIAKDRSRVLTEMRFDISNRKYEQMIGRCLSVLATEVRVPGTTFLRTVNYRPVVVEEKLDLSKWYDVEVTGYTNTHLVGRRVG
jgi:MiaB-like tRNA modifying enzyme